LLFPGMNNSVLNNMKISRIKSNNKKKKKL